MDRRLFLLPLIWGAFGIVEVYALRYLFGNIANVAPTAQNDKPIGGSVLPVLFFNVIMLFVVLSASLFAVGIWRIDLGSRKSWLDIGALMVLSVSGFLFWYNALALFTALISLGYFLVVNIE